MSIHRYAARVDANQTQIVSALRAAGALVYHLKLPVDLLVGDRESGRLMLMDCKMPKTGQKTALQAKFEREWAGLPISFVDGPEAAVRHFRLLRTSEIVARQIEADIFAGAGSSTADGTLAQCVSKVSGG